MDTHYAEARAQYLLFADKYKLHMDVTKLGYTPERREPGKGYCATGNAQFHYQVKLTVGTKNPVSDILPGTGAPLVIDWHCGEAVPMSDDRVIARVKKYGQLATWLRLNPRYLSCTRMTLDQLSVNKAFIKAATEVYEPGIVDILSCLRSDLSCVYYEGVGFAVDFKAFCDELGYNSDSIKDKQCYEAIMEQSQALLQLLGREGIDELLALEGL